MRSCRLLIAASLIVISAPAFAAKTKIRIGWQVPWAIQGQLVQVLKKTDILAKNGLEAEFVGKTAGPELNELAMAGELDVLLTADQPASTLFMKNKNWQGILRLMYNRTSTYVPPKSDIKVLADLKGKKVGVPFGTAAQRIINEAVEAEKVSDVNFINLGMLEHAPLIDHAGPEDKKWGDYDALSGFDPIPAILEANGKVRMISKGKVCALVVINKDFLGKNKGIGAKLNKSLKQAWAYYKAHISEANDLFVKESQLTKATPEALALAAEYEPNFKEKDIRTKFNDEDFVMIQKAADFVSKNTKININIKDFVSNDYQ